MFANPDDAIARVEDDIRRAQQRAERMSQLRSEAEAVRGSAISRQRDIEVEMDHTGQVTGVIINDQALDRGGRRVAADIMELLGRARQDVQAQMLEVASRLLGEDDPLLDMLRPAEAEGEGRSPQSSGRGWG